MHFCLVFVVYKAFVLDRSFVDHLVFGRMILLRYSLCWCAYQLAFPGPTLPTIGSTLLPPFGLYLADPPCITLSGVSLVFRTVFPLWSYLRSSTLAFAGQCKGPSSYYSQRAFFLL